MKIRIFNPTNSEVNVKVLGVRVVIAPHRADLVDASIGRELQEFQPQLEYTQIDDGLVAKAEKDKKNELLERVEEAEAQIEKVEAEAKKQAKEANAKIKELEAQLKPKETKTKESNKSNKSKSNDKKKK